MVTVSSYGSVVTVTPPWCAIAMATLSCT